jgi:hypothetical protein
MIHYVFLRLRGKNALAAGNAFACPALLKTASGPHWINQLRLGNSVEPGYSSDVLAQPQAFC